MTERKHSHEKKNKKQNTERYIFLESTFLKSQMISTNTNDEDIYF